MKKKNNLMELICQQRVNLIGAYGFLKFFSVY